MHHVLPSFLPTAPSPGDALGGVLGLVTASQHCRQGTLNALSEAASDGRIMQDPGTTWATW